MWPFNTGDCLIEVYVGGGEYSTLPILIINKLYFIIELNFNTNRCRFKWTYNI
jgi:hypothetical protein